LLCAIPKDGAIAPKHDEGLINCRTVSVVCGFVDLIKKIYISWIKIQGKNNFKTILYVSIAEEIKLCKVRRTWWPSDGTASANPL